MGERPGGKKIGNCGLRVRRIRRDSRVPKSPQKFVQRKLSQISDLVGSPASLHVTRPTRITGSGITGTSIYTRAGARVRMPRNCGANCYRDVGKAAHAIEFYATPPSPPPPAP
jgi:hypothetical protein